MIVPDPAGPGGERVKVLDFGIAKLATSQVHTKAGQIMGTLSHMSPEQIRSPGQVDGQSDVYSLGTVLYYLLAGEPPFVAKESDFQVLTMHLMDPPPPINGLVPELSVETTRLIMRMLNKQPQDRPSMAEVAAQLLELDPAGSSHSMRRPSRVSIEAIKPLPPTAENFPVKRAVTESLNVSTFSHSTGQRVSTKPEGRQALPALLALALVLVVGTVVAVVGFRSPDSIPKSPDHPALRRRLEPQQTSPPSDPTAEQDLLANTPPAAGTKASRIGKSKPSSLDSKTQSPDKPRKKNAPHPGKTTPLIR